MTIRAHALLVCCAICAACGGKKPDSAAPGDRVTGSERIGWNQQASDAAELASFRYAIYVDGARSELTDVTCAPAPPSFTCSARLPSFTTGPHTLELAAFISDLGIVESPKSAPLRVTAGLVAFSLPGDGNLTFVRSSGAPVATQLIADGLNEPTDLAFAPDGRIFIAERSGRLRAVRDGVLDGAVGVIDDLDTRGGGGLLAVAMAPGFAQTHHVYTLETAAGRDNDRAFRVARYREVNGTLGDRAILLDGIPAAPVQPRGALRFGPDGLLYLAFDDGGDDKEMRDRSPYNGTLLRVTAEGTTPRDQVSPIIGQGFRSPRGLTWSPASGRLWVADMRADGSEQLVAGSTHFTLPSDTGASAMAFARSTLMVAGAEAMLRVQIGESQQVETVERLVGGEGLTPVRVVAVSPAGEIYFATETTLGRVLP